MDIFNVSEGIIVPSAPIKYYGRSTAKIDLSSDQSTTELILRPPDWRPGTSGTTSQQLGRSILASIRPTHPTKIVRVRDIYMLCKPNPPDNGAIYIMVSYDYYDTVANAWKELIRVQGMSIEFSLTQLG